MTQTLKVFGGIAAFLVVAALVFAGVVGFSGSTYGVAGVNYFEQGVRWTQEGLFVGSSQQFSVDSSGNLSTSGTATFSGGTTASPFTEGGGVTATSTSGNVVPLLESDFDTENIIDVTLNVQDATLSFPATSTLTSFIPTAGQTRTLFVRNATTTATMDLTISGGTGVLLKKATSTAVVYGDTDGANYARIDLTRKSNTDIEALLTIFMD